MLPILEIKQQIAEHMAASNRLVLTAPTGSGKTTQVPQILYHAMPKTSGQIVVLQPRRLATRMVAHRVASEMNCAIGSVVGYQTRHERQVSPQTRIRFMTEGLLLRLLQSDPTLSGVEAVILDEFHERNLAADMALGLLRRLQQSTRPDLKLIVMSATLDAQRIAEYLQCESLQAGGRLFPVEIRYLPKPSQKPCWDLAADALAVLFAAEESQQDAGDVLIFMPGVYEINRTIAACQRQLAGSPACQAIQFFPLHGALPLREQDAAMQPCAKRKVVVATNVAETSITIEGIRYVIDSGLAKIHRYQPQRALNVLRVEPISKASADQRTGRAGRLGPGVCMRLWTQREHRARADHESPEVQRLDLAEAVLQLKSMGVDRLMDFPWLEPPGEEAVERAEKLLTLLGATNEYGSITALGKKMARVPIHPRLSRTLMEAADRGCLPRAILAVALVSERDIFERPQAHLLQRYLRDDEPESDLLTRAHVFEELAAARFDRHQSKLLNVNVIACRAVQQSRRLLEGVCQRLKLPMDGDNCADDLFKSLLVGFPDHIAVRLDAQRLHCAMTGRRRVVLDRESVVRDPGLLLALDVREVGRGDSAQTELSLASRIDPVWLEEVHPHSLSQRIETRWNPESQAVEQVQEHIYDGLVISRTVRSQVNPADAAELLVQQIMQGQLALTHWNEEVEQWIARTRCVAKWFPERGLIEYSDDDIAVILHEIVSDATRYSQIRDRPCLQAVRDALSWDDQQFVERMAPRTLQLPRGYRMRLSYSIDAPPRARAKIQDLYDLHETPRVAGGRQEVLLEILAPNFRPIQVTSDLRGFWQTLYPEVKKELRRRYPKHEWR